MVLMPVEYAVQSTSPIQAKLPNELVFNLHERGWEVPTAPSTRVSEDFGRVARRKPAERYFDISQPIATDSYLTSQLPCL